MRVLITGAAGFAGAHLAEHISTVAPDAEVFGTYSSSPLPGGFRGKGVELNLNKLGDLESVIKDVKPDEVYHMAALSFVPEANKNPPYAYQINSVGTCNLLEALARNTSSCKTLVVSSAEVYGKVKPDENPVPETREPAPANHYSASKLCAEIIAGQYAHSGKLHVVIARPFNFTGPGQSQLFAAPAFATQIARIEAGLQEPVIKTGNLGAMRDFCDVRDVVRAFTSILEKAESGAIYNICSGIPMKIESVYNRLVNLSNYTGKIEHVLDPDRARASENPVVYGSASRLNTLTGWAPVIALDKTLEDLLEERRNSLDKQ